MMTASIDQAPPAGSVRPTDLIAPARWLLGRQLAITRWFIGLVAFVMFALAQPLIARFGGELGFSLWENFAANGPGWFLLAMGATAASQYLPVLVAQGVTRGRFAVAAALALAAGAVVLGVMVALGFMVEAWLYARSGWEYNLLQGHLFDSYSQLPIVVAEYAVRFLLFGVVGLLIGYGYYRVGGWWGTLLLLFTLIVPLAFGIILLSQEVTAFNSGWQVLGEVTATGLGLTLLYTLVLVVVARALLATVPIRTKVG